MQLKRILFATAFGDSTEVFNISSGGKLNNFLSIGEIAQKIATVANNSIHFKNLVKVNFSDENFYRAKGLFIRQ